MLSVTVHKDIGEYKEKVVGKMSARTLACIAGAIAASFATAAIAYFAFGVPVSNAAFPVTAASMPFWLLGFWRPKGLAPEAFVPLWAAHVLGDGKLPYLNAGRIPVLSVTCRKPDRKASRKAWKRGGEKRDMEKMQEDK